MLSETKVNLTKSDYENIPFGSPRLLGTKLLLLLLLVAYGERLWWQYFGTRRIGQAFEDTCKATTSLGDWQQK